MLLLWLYLDLDEREREREREAEGDCGVVKWAGVENNVSIIECVHLSR